MAKAKKMRIIKANDISSISKNKHHRRYRDINVHDSVSILDGESNGLFISKGGKDNKFEKCERRSRREKGGKKTMTKISTTFQRDRAERGESPCETSNEGSLLAMIAKQRESSKREKKDHKKFLKHFTRRVTRKGKDLKNRIGELMQISVQRDHDFLESFRTAFNLSQPHKNLIGNRSEVAEGSCYMLPFVSLHSYSQELIFKAQSTMELFENAQKKIINSIDVVEIQDQLERNEDINELEHLLKIGQAVGIDRYNSMIQGVKANSISANNGSGKEKQFVKYLYDSEGRIYDTNWGMIVQKQIRALKKLVKVSDAGPNVT